MKRVACILACCGVCAGLIGAGAVSVRAQQAPAIAGMAEDAVTLGRDLDGDGDADEVHIRLEVIEITQEVYPGGHIPDRKSVV